MILRSLEYGIVLMLLSLLSPLQAADATVCKQLAQTASPETFAAYQPARVAFETIYGDDSLRDFRPATPQVLRLDSEIKYRATIGAPSDGVDFNEAQLLLIFIGERPAGGYSVKVERIQRLQAGPCMGHLYIYFIEKKPAGKNKSVMTATHPYLMIKLDRKGSPAAVAQIHLLESGPAAIPSTDGVPALSASESGQPAQ